MARRVQADPVVAAHGEHDDIIAVHGPCSRNRGGEIGVAGACRPLHRCGATNAPVDLHGTATEKKSVRMMPGEPRDTGGPAELGKCVARIRCPAVAHRKDLSRGCRIAVEREREEKNSK